MQLNYKAKNLSIKWEYKICLAVLFSDKLRSLFWHLLLICRDFIYAKKNVHNIITMWKEKGLEERLIPLTENCCILISSLSPVTGIHKDNINPQLATSFRSQVELCLDYINLNSQWRLKRKVHAWSNRRDVHKFFPGVLLKSKRKGKSWA